MMETKMLKNLKRGEYFKRKADAKKVFIRGDYNRDGMDSDRFKYECQDFDDINRFIYLKGETEVFVGFDF